MTKRTPKANVSGASRNVSDTASLAESNVIHTIPQSYIEQIEADIYKVRSLIEFSEKVYYNFSIDTPILNFIPLDDKNVKIGEYLLNEFTDKCDQTKSSCSEILSKVLRQDLVSGDAEIISDIIDNIKGFIHSIITITNAFIFVFPKASRYEIQRSITNATEAQTILIILHKEVASFINMHNSSNALNNKDQKNKMPEKYNDDGVLTDRIRDSIYREGLTEKDLIGLIDGFIRQRNIFKASANRIKWENRHSEANLEFLTAPEFLKVVHAEDIHDGVVDKEFIRAVDKSLMDAVETYISKREKRNQSLGRAQGLTFILSRPSYNKRKGQDDPTPS